MRKKLIDKELINNMNVKHFTAYLTMSMKIYLTAGEIRDRTGRSIATMYHWLDAWEELGLVEKIKYDGNEINTSYQYRRLYNRITIVRLGVLFEVVKEG